MHCCRFIFVAICCAVAVGGNLSFAEGPPSPSTQSKMDPAHQRPSSGTSSPTVDSKRSEILWDAVDPKVFERRSKERRKPSLPTTTPAEIQKQ